MAPIVTTGGCSVGKNFLTRHPCPNHAIFAVLKKGAMLIFQPMPTYLELCASALHRGHAHTLQIIDHVSHIVRVIHEGAMLLFFFFKKKTQYVRVILAQKAMQNISAQLKKRATASLQKRKSSFLRRSANSLLCVSRSAIP